MGSLLHIFEVNQGSMAKKVVQHKKQQDGFEAPRNSLELQAETYQNYYALGDTPYYYKMEKDWSENSIHTKEASMKKLISEEMTKRQNTNQAAPNIVARLMGVDMMPSDTKSVMRSVEKDKENRGKKLTKKERNKPGSVTQESSKSSMLIDLGSTYNGKDGDDDGWNCYQNSGKPKPREHPQEEELQKFKKEFELWQAARVMECSKVVEGGGVSRGSLAQENLNSEKMKFYADSQGVASATLEPWSNTGSLQRSASQSHSGTMILLPEKQKEFYRPRSRALSGDFEQSLLIKCNARSDKSSPTRIVILKPGPDKVSNHEDSWVRSTDTFDERNSIEEFLQEVRERLKCELQGKTLKKGSVVRGSGIETPHCETPSYPKQIARRIARQVRESVSRDMKINLPRSESTRSYKSEVIYNEPGSPEFMNRDTRRFLSERLRNVLKSETYLNPQEEDGIYRSTSLDSERLGIKQAKDTSQLANGSSYWDAVNEQEKQPRSFRQGRDDNITVHGELSPRNLVRSLSAPVSGTSFGKLLLEDRHVFTGAHIHRKHEANEAVPRDVEKRKKKHKFNFKERVSTLKHSFIIRGMLFGKKMQPLVESHSNGHDSMTRDFTNGPTVLRSLGDRRENATEVPPSPASLCSSSHEDFWRPGEYLSPISTPDFPSRDDNVVPHVFREISSDLNELRRQLNQLGSESAEEKTSKEDPIESELVELEDEAESYLRDLLIASGLYSGSWDKALLKGDTFVKAIGNSVFEEVEESRRKLAKENGSSPAKDHDTNSHKILFDLLNEALSKVLGPPKKISKCMRKSSSSSTLCGKNLLDSVWKVVRSNLYPPSDKSYYSIDNMVARDLHSVPWLGSTDDEVNSLGREIECLIVGDMIDDIVKDMKFSKVL